MAFFDTSVQRESACPVHFVWDGNGLGRPVVRVAFLLCLVAGALGALGAMTHHEGVAAAARACGIIAGSSWCLGQGLTRLAHRRHRLRAAR